MNLSDDQRFINALRNFLDKAPFYGADEGYGGVATHEETIGSRSDEWFAASQGGSPVLGRDEWRDAKTTAARKRKDVVGKVARDTCPGLEGRDG